MTDDLHILALEPFYGGSHRAFLDGWVKRSRHRWTLLGLPAYKWKWRMRHAAVTLAKQVKELLAEGRRFDVLFCSDMLSLAEFRGLAPASIARLPAVAYFHESQLTYPGALEKERDHHFAFTNFTTALAADAVWFNSRFHRREFLRALRDLLRRMPDYQPLEQINTVEAKSHVRHPGVEEITPGAVTAPDRPLRIAWVGRWEHDKNPGDFFAALETLAAAGHDFRLSILGESFSTVPPEFAAARERFADRIDHFGYLTERADYLRALRQCDVVVSTARHEFFGIAVCEAILAGCFPLLPRRLSYPELLQAEQEPTTAEYFYEASAADLATRLEDLIQRKSGGERLLHSAAPARESVSRFRWTQCIDSYDDALANLRLRGA